MRNTNCPVKILHVGPLPPPVGGMATVIDNLATTLADVCDVKVLNNIKTTAKNRSQFQGVVAQLRLLARLAYICLIWRPDVVHIHTCSWFSFWRSSADIVLARVLWRRVMLHIHGAEFKTFLDSLPPFKARLARMILSACNRVIVLGQGWKNLLDCWCCPARVKIVPNGVATQPQRVLINDDVFTILCLANYERRKGQADLLQAVAAIRTTRPIRVACLGFEAESGQQLALLALASELGLTDKVDISGSVTGALKETWWARASCFCLPSYNEGLPMSMLEAMARGVPVIATRVGAIPEAVDDRRDGLLYEAGDIPGLTSLIQKLLDDPVRTESIGYAGRQRLIRDFTLEKSCKLLLSIYCDLMQNKCRACPEFSVNGPLAGNCRLVRRHSGHQETRRT